MGIDATIFAKNNKKRFYFDRLYNITKYIDIWYDDNITPEQFSKLDKDYSKLMNVEVGLSHIEALNFISINKRAWNDDDHGLWCDAIIKFIMDNPMDTFFVMTDDTEDYYEVRDQYQEITYDEG